MERSQLLFEDMKHNTSQWMPMLNGQDRVGKFAEHKSCSSQFYCEWMECRIPFRGGRSSIDTSHDRELWWRPSRVLLLARAILLL